MADAGLDIRLGSGPWEPMDVVGRSSTKGPLHPSSTAFVIVDMQPLFYDQASPWGVPGGLAKSNMKHLWPKQLRIAEAVSRFTGRNDSTFLLKFVVPETASDAAGIWRHYYSVMRASTARALRDAGHDPVKLQGIMPQLSPLLAGGARAVSKSAFGAFGPGSALPDQLEDHPGVSTGAGAHISGEADIAGTRAPVQTVSPVITTNLIAGSRKDYFASAATDTLEKAPTEEAGQAKTLIIAGVETDMCVLSTVLAAIDNGYRVVLVADAVGSSQPNSGIAQLDYTLRRFDSFVDIVLTRAVIAALTSAQ